ncbi:hypothetical protein BN6_57890 [Saccharothrix espanaensis DSM 44229]|uniref:Uncharacterized protein n=1 Tax=Saccharothrix espanaensis (strain ATCC 51144 / DSM 44229 / JCM 9112 / NBRC 15066 / NRRL 15764) TaxID=1179773 RepID=K0K692_SACES|nr:hypothetical protein BN6_57890 [Saccharothrix espanaensis DSM 44229]
MAVRGQEFEAAVRDEPCRSPLRDLNIEDRLVYYALLTMPAGSRRILRVGPGWYDGHQKSRAGGFWRWSDANRTLRHGWHGRASNAVRRHRGSSSSAKTCASPPGPGDGFLEAATADTYLAVDRGSVAADEVRREG